jgi:hypothetical protein
MKIGKPNGTINVKVMLQEYSCVTQDDQMTGSDSVRMCVRMKGPLSRVCQDGGTPFAT